MIDVASLVASVESAGFARVRLDLDDTVRLVNALGEVLIQTEVCLNPKVHTWLAQPDPIPAHTDHPDVDRIVWRCERQDPIDGAQLLVDTSAILDALGDAADALHDVTLGVPALLELQPSARRAMLDEDGVYWSPWQDVDARTPEAAEALTSWRALLASGVGATRIRLDPGDVLVIDNRRILHGRGALPPGSQRLLRRWWVKRRA